MILHLRGPILVGPDDVRPEAWVVGGRLTFDRPSSVEGAIDGWVPPGLVDAHGHIGPGHGGAVDKETTEQQALTARDSGALLLRDAGSPADTRWVDDRADLPRVIRAGRHVARTRRYGDWIDRDTGDLSLCWPVEVLAPAIAAAHTAGARVTAHCFSEDSLVPLAEAGIDCIEHATGLTEASIPVLAARGVAIVPTLVNIATFPDIAAGAGRFPAYQAHMLDLHTRRYATVGAAFEAGIAVYAGTDAGGSLPHGLLGQEALELSRAGLPNTAVLDAARSGRRRGWASRGSRRAHRRTWSCALRIRGGT